MGQMGPTRDLGPCVPVLGGTEVGETKGGTFFRSSEDTEEVNEDKWGTTPVDKIYVGEKAEVETNLTRLSIAKLTKALPGATTGNGTTGITGMIKKSLVGKSMRDNGKLLILKPIVDGAASTNENEWLTAFVAAARSNLELAYTIGDQRVYKTIFEIFPVLTANEGVTGTKVGYLWAIGWDHA